MLVGLSVIIIEAAIIIDYDSGWEASSEANLLEIISKSNERFTVNPQNAMHPQSIQKPQIRSWRGANNPSNDRASRTELDGCTIFICMRKTLTLFKLER